VSVETSVTTITDPGAVRRPRTMAE
jgi:hypothetical protein